MRISAFSLRPRVANQTAARSIAAPLAVLSLVAAMVVSAPITAQIKTVVPAANSTVEGNAFDLRPFGLNRGRLTQLISMKMLGISRGKQISELAYRRDGTILLRTAMQRRASTTWSIRLGNLNTGVRGGAPFSPRNPIGLYLRPGSGTNSLREYFNAIPSWPRLLPKVGSTPDFALRFKLRSPFVVQGPSGIAVDHFVYGRTGRTEAYYVDAQRSDIDLGKVREFGASCPKTENRAYAFPSNPGGDDAEFFVFGTPARAVSVLIIGGSNTNWGSVKLPLKLDGLGLAGCSVHVSQDILLPTFASSTGSAKLLLKMPNDVTLAGAKVYSQWMIFDSRVSQTLPLAFSNGVELTVGRSIGKTDFDASFLYGVNQSRVVRGRYGLVQRGIALVTEFVHN